MTSCNCSYHHDPFTSNTIPVNYLSKKARRPCVSSVAYMLTHWHADTLANANPIAAAQAVHSKLVRESLANNPTSSVGLDIGASPGGWTAYLAERCNQVIAVDPAEMDEGVKAKPNVVHIKAMLLDKTLDGVAFQAGSEGTDQLAALQEAFTQTYDSIAAEAGAGITLVCCDVNKQPEEAAEISLRALPLMAEGGVFVITAKFSTRCKEKEQAQLLEAKKVLEEHCDQIEEHWLFSNTKHERTLVARFRGKSTFAGAKAKAAASSKGAAGSSGWVSGMNAGGGGGGKGGMKAAKKAAAAEQAMVQAPKYFGTLARMKRGCKPAEQALHRDGKPAKLLECSCCDPDLRCFRGH